MVIQQLSRLAEETDANPQSRLEALRAERDRIDRAIEEVDRVGVTALPAERALERAREIIALAEELTSDFRAVRDEFERLNRGLRQSLMENEGSRGDVLESLFAGVDLIGDSDAGIVSESELPVRRQRLSDLGTLWSSAGVQSPDRRIQQVPAVCAKHRVVGPSESEIRVTPDHAVRSAGRHRSWHRRLLGLCSRKQRWLRPHASAGPAVQLNRVADKGEHVASGGKGHPEFHRPRVRQVTVRVLSDRDGDHAVVSRPSLPARAGGVDVELGVVERQVHARRGNRPAPKQSGGAGNVLATEGACAVHGSSP
jgi:hypothetical protein